MKRVFVVSLLCVVAFVISKGVDRFLGIDFGGWLKYAENAHDLVNIFLGMGLGAYLHADYNKYNK